MYYEEKLISGVMCWRGTPDGEWTAYSLRELSRRYVELQREMAQLKESRNEA